MELPNVTDKGKVFLTCTMEKRFTWENIAPQHIVAFVYSGELELSYGKDRLTFVAGDSLLVPKNQLHRSIKKTVDGQAFKCVSIVLPEKQLRKFYQDRPVSDNWAGNISKERPIQAHALLDSFFASLRPYLDLQDELPDELVEVKIQEVLTIIDTVDKRASSILGSFSEPGKIDLEK